MSSVPEPPPSPAPSAAEGLSTGEAQRRLRDDGPNAVSEQRPSVWRRLAAKFWAPVPWMLEAAIILQLTLGESMEAAVVAVLVVFNALLGFVQEGRAEATLAALRSRLALVASVRRDGIWRTLPARELVAGDVVKLSLGAVVAADVRLLAGEVLLDQSMLTGESLPVEAGPGRDTYAGALVRRGEAVALVTATGARTRFGRTTELVRSAHGQSTQQQVVLRVVRNLALFNAALVLAQVAYASRLGLPSHELIPLTLTAILAAIPVALPATFTLAGAIGARELARVGVLPTRLSAVDEAGTLDVLCADKTGTLTQNALRVSAVRPMSDYDEAQVLALAALASAEGGQDPVDAAIRAAAAVGGPGVARHGVAHDALEPVRQRFLPFDPASKMAEAVVLDAHGQPLRIVKGAAARVQALSGENPVERAGVEQLAAQGFRVLAVAAGPVGAPLRLAGLLGLSDPPRADSATLIAQLQALGVRTLMVTGDAPSTAGVVARAVGLEGAVCSPPLALLEALDPQRYTVFAGVFPEDKFHIVRALQKAGHTVGMCGDGANDAPALRQAQMGIAVSTATDVAKSAAGIVLTEAGLSGIVSAVRQGRLAFQRILIYTLRSMTLKIGQILLLAVGLVMTGHAVLTPRLIVIILISGDFLAMSATTDHVLPPPRPERWHVNHLTLLGGLLGIGYLGFCSAVLAYGHFGLRLPIGALRTLVTVALVAGGQAAYYTIRARGWLWSSRPSRWVVLSTLANVLIVVTLAWRGWLMQALPVPLIGATLLAAVLFALALDVLKTAALGILRQLERPFSATS